MKNFKLFKKAALLLTVIALAAVLTIGVVAGIAWSQDGASYGEKYSGVQLTMKGQLYLQFYYSDLGTAEKMVAEVIDPDTEETNRIEYTGLVAGAKGYCVSVPLAPSQMTHTVRVYAYGDQGASKAIEYSVKEYAQNVLADNTLSSWHDQMRTLLNWGAMAQLRYEDAVNTLANEDVFARNSNPASAVASIPCNEGSVTPGSAITGNTVNLSLEKGDVALHFYVNYSGTETLTATVSREGLAETPTSVIETETEGVYLVRITNVTVGLFDKDYTVTVKAGEDTFTATKSVLWYLNELLEGEKYTDAQKNVARSMYQFYQTATDNTGADKCEHKTIYWLAGDVAKCASCFGKHVCDANYTLATVGTNYQVQCGLCGEVTYDYNTDTSAAVQYRDDYAVGAYTEYKGTRLDAQFENGSPRFARLFTRKDGTDTYGMKALGGSALANCNYLVVMFRVGENGLEQSTMDFIINNSLGFSIAVEEDNKWHTVIIDLKARAGDGTVYDGNYNGYLLFRPFGDKNYEASGSETAYVDFAYMAGCATLDDVSKLVGEDTYEWSVSSTKNVEVDADTNRCVDDHAFAYIDSRGHYCVLCDASKSEMYAHDLVNEDGDSIGECECGYTACAAGCTSFSHAADGTNYLVKCNACGAVTYDYNTNTSAAVKYRGDYDVGASTNYNGFKRLDGQLEAGSPKFVRLFPRAKDGETAKDTYGMNALGGSALANCNYLVIMFRVGNNGFGQTTMNFNIGSGAFNVAVSEDNQWHTVIIDLKARTGNAYNGSYNGTLTFYPFGDAGLAASGSETAYVDFAYMAGCATLDDAAKVAGGETYEWSVDNKTNAVRDADDGSCVTPHTLVHVADSTNYLVKCNICDTVTYDYDTDTSAAVKYRDDTNVGASTNYNGFKRLDGQLEAGSPKFVRLFPRAKDGETAKDTYGMNALGSGALTNCNYLVVMFRVGENGLGQSTMDFVINNSLGFSIAVEEDDQWHTVIIDLKARIGNGTVYDGNYNGYLLFRPFGDKNYEASGSETAYVDFAYMAGCATLEDAAKVAGGETYEWSVDSTKNAVRDADDHSCVTHALAHAADGTNYLVKCDACDAVTYNYNTDTSAAVKYRDDAAVGAYTSYNGFKRLDGQLEVGSPKFVRLFPRAKNGETATDTCGMQGLGGAFANCNFLVVMFRVGENGLEQSTMDFIINNSLGFSIAVEEDNKWHTVIIDLKARIGDGTQYDGNYNGYLLFRPFGDKNYEASGSKTAYVDFAYMAGCATLEDAVKVAGGETYEWSVGSTKNEVRNTADLVAE